jgi:hypothetical protein
MSDGLSDANHDHQDWERAERVEQDDPDFNKFMMAGALDGLAVKLYSYGEKREYVLDQVAKGKGIPGMKDDLRKGADILVKALRHIADQLEKKL